MKKIIIILIITLTTFIGGDIYTNNLKQNSNDQVQNIDVMEEENSTNSENLSDDFQTKVENLEDKKEIEVSNDKENEKIQPKESNVIVTVHNAEEKKKIEKKITEETKKEKIEVSQPEEEPKAVETKSEPTKEPEPVNPKCSGTNHGVGVGNSNKWFNSKQEAIAYYDSLIKTWGDKWESFEIDSATYDKNCPYGYEVWTCPFCGKWTINFYYR